jgi:hypothetical protein
LKGWIYGALVELLADWLVDILEGWFGSWLKHFFVSLILILSKKLQESGKA